MQSQNGPEDGDINPEGGDAHPEPEEGSKLVRLRKSVGVIGSGTAPIDESVVSPRLYNAFNYSLITRNRGNVRMVVGIASANPGEGKTLVACNLAVSLAMVYERDVVVVDLNVAAPAVHRVFGVAREPGLLESMNEPIVTVHKTRVPHLFILPAGSMHTITGTSARLRERVAPGQGPTPSLGLEQVAEFRDVLYSLQEEFDFVIVDMPATNEPGVPLILTNQMDGVLVVVDTNRTKKEHIDRMFRTVHQSHVLGFVFNRAGEELLGG